MFSVSLPLIGLIIVNSTSHWMIWRLTVFTGGVGVNTPLPPPFLRSNISPSPHQLYGQNFPSVGSRPWKERFGKLLLLFIHPSFDKENKILNSTVVHFAPNCFNLSKARNYGRVLTFYLTVVHFAPNCFNLKVLAKNYKQRTRTTLPFKKKFLFSLLKATRYRSIIYYILHKLFFFFKTNNRKFWNVVILFRPSSVAGFLRKI